MRSSTFLLAFSCLAFAACSGTQQQESELAGFGRSGPGPLQQAALKKCLAKWSGHPFSQQHIQAARVIAAAVTVNGQGQPVVDAVTTPGPELILIAAAVNVGGSATYELRNPNGYYCMQTVVNVDASTTVNLACGAKLADPKVQVGVGNDGSPLGAVGVHVGSNVTVNRPSCS